MEITLFPLEKVQIDGKAISFGMKKEEVHSLLGKPEFIDDDESGERDYFYDSELAINFDKSGAVEFIEFLGGIDGTLKPMIYGISAFDSMADELYEVLEKENSGEIVDDEDGYSYSFKEIEVGVYRDSKPEDAMECIEEMKAEGTCTKEDEEYELRRANHWATIGIGVKGYY